MGNVRLLLWNDYVNDRGFLFRDVVYYGRPNSWTTEVVANAKRNERDNKAHKQSPPTIPPFVHALSFYIFLPYFLLKQSVPLSLRSLLFQVLISLSDLLVPYSLLHLHLFINIEARVEID